MGGIYDEKPRNQYMDGCVTRMTKSMLQGAAGGVFIGSALLSWYPDPYRVDAKGMIVNKPLGVMYVMRGLTAPVLWGTLVCTTYTGVECMFESLRDETHSGPWLNSAAGGAAAGLVMGAMTRRFDIMATTAMSLGAIMGMFEFNRQHTKSKKLLDFPLDTSKTDEVTPPETKKTSALEDLKQRYPEYKDL